IPIDHDSPNIDAIFITQDHNANQDVSDNIIGTTKGALSVVVRTQPNMIIPTGAKDKELMTIELSALSSGGGQVLVKKMVFELLGSVQDEDIERIKLIALDDFATIETGEELKSAQPMDVVPGGKERIGGFDQKAEQLDYSLEPGTTETLISAQNGLKNGNYEVVFEPPITITEQKPTILEIGLDISPNTLPGSCLGLKLKELVATNATVTIHHLAQELVYIGKIPNKIQIDGAFGDWQEVEKYQDIDDTMIFNPDIDIQEFAVANENNELDFYFHVSGELLSASRLPIQLMPINNKFIPIPADNKNEVDVNKSITPSVEKLPPALVAKDRLHIFLDTDRNSSTGYKFEGMPIGAEFMVQITGREGRIDNQALYKYPTIIEGITLSGSAWAWEFVDNIPAANEQSQLETGINLNLLNIDLEEGLDIWYILSNWDTSINDNSELFSMEFPQETDEILNDDQLED
ncbi:MAG: hypothetical protein KAJ51_17275, partial [Thermoplasmata archaeon]|nr:hypothetical protein [Thermoplasmata archaeon]